MPFPSNTYSHTIKVTLSAEREHAFQITTNFIFALFMLYCLS